MRIEIFYHQRFRDGRALRLLESLNTRLQLDIQRLSLVDVYLLDGLNLSAEQAEEIFSDPVAQCTVIDSYACIRRELDGWDILIEVTTRPGVTDPVALTAREALKSARVRLSETGAIQTARQYLVSRPSLSPAESQVLAGIVHNPLIQRAVVIDTEAWRAGSRPPKLYPSAVPPSPIQVESFRLQNQSDEELNRLSRRRLLALSLEEMKAVQKKFMEKEFKGEREARGLTDSVTDVELEMIAQTWSEHCKHKIFGARILYRENGRQETIDSLFETYIRKTTEELSHTKTYLKSVFHDNSGVVQFDEQTLICFKVETHNSPSALDPYGGAITGIVGVNRDIIGTGKGAKPIFNTNVLCFGPPDIRAREVPRGLLHPRQVMEGVHRGIVDGGNQSGIPVVGGAFLFDESYIGKPLVFCGTGGILPSEIGGEEAWIDHVDPNDLAVMVGGRIGKDGIHGATFSSQPLDEGSPTSAVQIGDPITQKKMLDFLLEARDRRLFKGITDNGAGGLSSSLGEMANRSGGVRIDLDRCPLKYKGLAPWEILVSESQERMSLAVSPERMEELLSLAARRDVEATAVGTFTDTGYVEIYYSGRAVGFLPCSFLHHGFPRMHLEARWTAPEAVMPRLEENRDVIRDILSLLGNPDIASKEELVRQYDHEVQARSVTKPFVGTREDGPSDGAVLLVRADSHQGITVTHGICPRYGDFDPFHMAMCAVDEAFRAHIACGGDPDRVSALDNFCWPDPLPSEENPDALIKLARLVRACKGLREACLAYSLPLISGKDSMKNDALVEGKKLSVRPTLLISLLGVIPDVRKSVTPDFKREGHALFMLGETRGELGGTCFERLYGKKLGLCPRVVAKQAIGTFRLLYKAMMECLAASCHDLSDGGLAVALCESALAGRLGARINLDEVPGEETEAMETERLLFCETPSRFLISAPEGHAGKLLSLFEGMPFSRIGTVTEEPVLRISRNGTEVAVLDLSQVESAWKTPI
ncbi:MAG TPA: AIR synthase-related protein [Spirochaetia bacterium]|nr:AIR synthase-related protein [Spirochaetia bacterium]